MPTQVRVVRPGEVNSGLSRGAGPGGIARRHPHPRNKKLGLADIDMSAEVQSVVADGISMNAALRFLPERSFPAFFGHLDYIRCNKDHYRARYVTLPFDASQPIEARDTNVTVQKLNVGSIVWGLNFDAVDGSLSDFEVQISDIHTSRKLWSQSVQATALSADGSTDLYPVIIEPLYMRAPRGSDPKLKVEITNKASSDQRCQLLVLVAEPCSTQLSMEYTGGYPWNTLQDESGRAAMQGGR